ncbi:hypothetical protein EJ02DRAFT_461022 [Clathrospora elynae]|uniref:Uncharacterized protein n=1 Tax=Clathrospora elynae TaxID=706981 RepID=A0A6A5S1S2_9PLEO|nr:hypothetical protein EJ02DRAFT_461022 [Clathrospora elynae]
MVEIIHRHRFHHAQLSEFATDHLYIMIVVMINVTMVGPTARIFIRVFSLKNEDLNNSNIRFGL